jgi:hypothetical protein
VNREDPDRRGHVPPGRAAGDTAAVRLGADVPAGASAEQARLEVRLSGAASAIALSVS